jgi:hypothetical protein
LFFGVGYVCLDLLALGRSPANMAQQHMDLLMALKAAVHGVVQAKI